MQLSRLIRKTERIIKKAARIMIGSFSVTEKEGNVNIVTSADLAIQQYLSVQLSKLLPQSDFFGEENPYVPADRKYIWVVDPIDGTTNFSRGIDTYAVSVALLEDNEAVLAVVYCPGQRKMYTATKGNGAFCNGRPIHVSCRPFDNSLLCTAMSLYRKEYANQCIEVIREAYGRCNDIRRLGSCAMELCLLAEGKCDLYFEYRVFPWDYAAAALILQEAGGIIHGENGTELKCDKPTPLIAANTKENCSTLNDIVHRHIPHFPAEEVFR